MSKARDAKRLTQWQEASDAKRESYQSAKYGPSLFGLPESCTRGMYWNTRELKQRSNSTDSRLIAIIHK